MRPMTATLAVLAMLGSNAAIAQDSNDALRRAIDDHLANQSAVADSGEVLAEPVLFTDEELDELLAPLALYPDALLAQVLVAATFPSQVTDAAQLVADSAELSEEELASRLESQEWDPSVLILTSGFPTVVTRMAEDIDATTDLGDAMLQQDEDVLASVQRLRTQALETGYLTDNEAQVVEQEEDWIAIKPADPEIVYVPSYDPNVVYTSAPTASPYIEQPRTGGGLLSNPLTAGALAFGGALLVQELFGDDDDDDNDDGWDDYWDQGRPIDWRDRQVYARPRWAWDDDGPSRSWAWERDRYWDPNDYRWRRDGDEARWRYDAERRDTVGWLVLDDPNNGRPRVRAIRYDDDWTDQRARQQARRAAEERRQVRLQEARRENRIAARRAEERREEALAAERRERRIEEAKKEQAAVDHRRERRLDAAEQEQRQQARAERQRQQRMDQRQEQNAEAAAREKRQQERAARQERQQQNAAEPQRARQDETADRRRAAEQKAQDDAAKRRAARQQAAEQPKAKQDATDTRAARQKAAEDQAAQEARAQRQQQRAAEQQRSAQQQQRQQQRAAPQPRDAEPQEKPRQRRACRNGQDNKNCQRN
jgi:DNA segregation ATPase FtsK/SpoIIIE-like protein